jgi:transposase
LVDYFEVVDYKSEGEKLHLYFEEKNNSPQEFAKHKLRSKGFHDEVMVQDFPIRGQHAFLHIKGRRWLNHSANMVVSRNWDLLEKGTRMTADFAAFLKEISRF